MRCVTLVVPVARHCGPDVPRRDPPSVPLIALGSCREHSVSASIYAIVDRGAQLRPALARELRGSVVFEFSEGYAGTRIDFCGERIDVADASADDRAHDLLIQGSLPDIVALLAAPLAGGLPKPTSTAGRAALARLADGRVEIDGPLRLARGLTRLLSVAPASGPRRVTVPVDAETMG